MIPIALFSPLSILVSFSTLFGVIIHDTKVDQLTAAFLATPAIVASYEGVTGAIKNTDPHTHVERMSLSQYVRGMSSDNPRIQPRLSNEKKYMLQKNVMKGHHPFDNYFLPVVG
jgi:hypothetical protein